VLTETNRVGDSLGVSSSHSMTNPSDHERMSSQGSFMVIPGFDNVGIDFDLYAKTDSRHLSADI
jgi:hypothetical protein